MCRTNTGCCKHHASAHLESLILWGKWDRARLPGTWLSPGSLSSCSVKSQSPASSAAFLILFKFICSSNEGGREKEGLETPPQNLMGSSSSSLQVCCPSPRNSPQKLLFPTAHAGWAGWGWKWANPGQFKHCPFPSAASCLQAWAQQEIASFPSPWAAPSGTGPLVLCHHLRWDSAGEATGKRGSKHWKWP